jgi:ABC-2 type transport system ATP-binding protein
VPATADLAIAVRGLRKTFGNLAAVDGLDLAVRPGELFALVGPDGAGKSTTIRLLCGLLEPAAGDIRILGRDLRAEPAAVKARLGYLSQSFSLYGDLTVDENIEFFADIHGVRDFRPRRDELLRATQLLPFRGRLARALSGGMKKKLALACTLVHRPGVVFLDEPTTGVDPVSRGELWAILGAMLEEGIAVLLTTPYLDEADRCDRVGLMHRGRMAATGVPAALRAQFAAPTLEDAFVALVSSATAGGSP